MPTPAPNSDADRSITAAERIPDDTPHDPQPEDTPLVALPSDTPDGREYTLCPASADAETIITTWLTVDADLVYDLDEWR
ncbi:DUF7511 domain-containing protein [Halorubellus litoreus]|uniref:DUF7511 domain-containing protein n=1 Tax=Halorubellus litoreus TaxID=755308 RepID=A0ABD5VF55_9EURY